MDLFQFDYGLDICEICKLNDTEHLDTLCKNCNEKNNFKKMLTDKNHWYKSCYLCFHYSYDYTKFDIYLKRLCDISNNINIILNKPNTDLCDIDDYIDNYNKILNKLNYIITNKDIQKRHTLSSNTFNFLLKNH